MDEINEVVEIPFAERKYLKENNFKTMKFFVYFLPFLIIFTYLCAITFNTHLKKKYSNISNIENIKNIDSSILGHLPYEEINNEDLVFIEPHIWVHKDMSDALLKMRKEAKKDGVNLIFLSGYRSIKLQEEIFYSLKSLRNQNASERARVSAPPGYSEHSTGFAIDIGDGSDRATDFEVNFENTSAFKWLNDNAARFHFRLSFNRDHKNVDYEPWHWRYEGSIEALKIFEASNRELKNATNLIN